MKAVIIYHYTNKKALEKILREGLKSAYLMGTVGHKQPFRYLSVDDRKCIYGRLVPDLFSGATGVAFDVDLDKTRAFIGDQSLLSNSNEYERNLMDLSEYLALSKEERKQIKIPEIFVCKTYIPPNELKLFGLEYKDLNQE